MVLDYSGLQSHLYVFPPGVIESFLRNQELITVFFYIGGWVSGDCSDS